MQLSASFLNVTLTTSQDKSQTSGCNIVFLKKKYSEVRQYLIPIDLVLAGMESQMWAILLTIILITRKFSIINRKFTLNYFS